MSGTVNAAPAIERAMSLYAQALDARDWARLDEVFADDVEMLTGAPDPVRGRAAAVAMIRSYLDACGPTQHLLGPTLVETADAATADSVTPFRAFHCDALVAQRTYEAIGRYHVRWAKTAAGWRALSWRYAVAAHLGDATLLGAGIP